MEILLVLDCIHVYGIFLTVYMPKRVIIRFFSYRLTKGSNNFRYLLLHSPKKKKNKIKKKKIGIYFTFTV